MESATNLPMRLDELKTLGDLFESSGMFGCKQKGQGIVLAMSCLMEGTTPLRFLNTYNLVDGRPSMRADAMVARFLEGGGTFKIISRTADKASVYLKKGEREGTFTFTWAEAKLEPFILCKDGRTIKKNYKTPWSRTQMLWARVVSDAVRTIDPGVNCGMYTPEEVQDFAHEPAIGEPVGPMFAAPPVLAALPEAATQVEEAATPVELVVDDDDAIATEFAVEMATLDEKHAKAYLAKIGWLEAGYELQDVAVEHMRKILARFETFAEKVAAFGTTQAGGTDNE